MPGHMTGWLETCHNFTIHCYITVSRGILIGVTALEVISGGF